jgi:2-oxoglutarate ferredoxin oxidoreductase subunit gamma
MTHEIILSGFGGQGIMAMGKMLAEAGMQEGLSVNWLPSYGPEVRGGTANCSVMLSSEPIVSPIVLEPTEIIVMNKPSLLRFEPELVSGGIAFINSSIIEIPATRRDISAFYVPCLDIAQELGNPRAANMVMLGAYIEVTQCLHASTVEKMLSHLFTGAKANLVALNKEALRRGAASILKTAC